ESNKIHKRLTHKHSESQQKRQNKKKEKSPSDIQQTRARIVHIPLRDSSENAVSAANSGLISFLTCPSLQAAMPHITCR
ncbi:hypothetical protein, partial [Aliiroseovarius halocynthiae]|uniref:hypothetical protein n=1 Tax=Aliiroseovarius halocynthiae TaxID=985055 RepID=UPI0024B7B682